MQFAQGADAQSVRRDIHQDRPDVDAGDQPALDGRPHRDRQVGLDLAVNRPPQPFFQQLVDQRRSSRSAHQHDLVDLVRLDLGVSERIDPGT